MSAAVFAVIVLSSTLARADVAQALASLEGDVKGWKGTVSADVIDVASGKTIASLDAHAPKNPASNAKLATAAAALLELGEEHRYLTGLYGAIEGDGVKELVLRGEGDPSLTTRDLEALARDLEAAGVKKVGAIEVDQSAFDDAYAPPAFDQQPNEWAIFRAPVSPVSLDENTVTMIVRPSAGGAAIVSFEPPGFVDVEGSIKTVAKGKPERVELTLVPRGPRLVAKISGAVPEGGRVVHVARRVDDPRLVPGFALASILKKDGVEVRGEPKLGGEGEKHLLASHRSPRLGALLASLGKDSDNFFAETIFKSLASTKRAKSASASEAAAIVEGDLRAMHAWDDGMMVKNGSGLFDANRVTASGVCALLRSSFRDPKISSEFVSQLSIGGVDGTLKERFKPWAKLRVVRAKTGTLHAVAAISGYVLAPEGKSPIAFSLLVNDIPGKTGEARASMDNVVDVIARSLWGNP